MRQPEQLPQSSVEFIPFPKPCEKLSTSELRDIMSGKFEGHYWITTDTYQICHSGTLELDDFATWTQLNRQFLNDDQNCQYGGVISASDARQEYRDRLWEEWKRVLQTE